MILTCLRSKPP